MKRVVEKEKNRDWLVALSTYFASFSQNMVKSVVGRDPSFQPYQEGKQPDDLEYSKYLAKAQKAFVFIETQMEKAINIEIDTETAPKTVRNINQSTISLQQLQKDLQEEKDIFKKYVLLGGIKAYQEILEKMIKEIEEYNQKHSSEEKIPKPTFW